MTCTDKDLHERGLRASQCSFDSSGKTPAEWHHRNNRQRPRRPTPGRLAAIARKPFIDISKIPQARKPSDRFRAQCTRAGKGHST
jgi:hypothetical protein